MLNHLMQPLLNPFQFSPEGSGIFQNFWKDLMGYNQRVLHGFHRLRIHHLNQGSGKIESDQDQTYVYISIRYSRKNDHLMQDHNTVQFTIIMYKKRYNPILFWKSLFWFWIRIFHESSFPQLFFQREHDLKILIGSFVTSVYMAV